MFYEANICFLWILQESIMQNNRKVGRCNTCLLCVTVKDKNCWLHCRGSIDSQAKVSSTREASAPWIPLIRILGQPSGSKHKLTDQWKHAGWYESPRCHFSVHQSISPSTNQYVQALIIYGTTKQFWVIAVQEEVVLFKNRRMASKNWALGIYNVLRHARAPDSVSKNA